MCQHLTLQYIYLCCVDTCAGIIYHVLCIIIGCQTCLILALVVNSYSDHCGDQQVTCGKCNVRFGKYFCLQTVITLKQTNKKKTVF